MFEENAPLPAFLISRLACAVINQQTLQAEVSKGL